MRARASLKARDKFPGIARRPSRAISKRSDPLPEPFEAEYDDDTLSDLAGGEPGSETVLTIQLAVVRGECNPDAEASQAAGTARGTHALRFVRFRTAIDPPPMIDEKPPRLAGLDQGGRRLEHPERSHQFQRRPFDQIHPSRFLAAGREFCKFLVRGAWSG